MSISRRDFLAASSGAALGLLGCAEPVPTRPGPLQGRILGRELAERGHRLWKPPSAAGQGAKDLPRSVDVAIIGAGVAGLSAGWRLARAGFAGSVLLVELGDALGGTSASGQADSGPFPLGAHYITLPSPENRHLRAMLRQFGVISGFDAEGHPRYDGEALCLAPQERLFVAGRWIEGLWPASIASAADRIQRDAWNAVEQGWRRRIGADGKPAFSIPIARSSADPAIRALSDISFSAWLDAQGFDSVPLRWLLNYACRDDYGTPLEQCSAWAGLHYHCARRPDPAAARDLGTHVLTWPAGNGWLVERLRETLPSQTQIAQPAIARVVDPDSGLLLLDQGGEAVAVRATRVILAVPARVADHLVGREPSSDIDQAPWRVAILHCDELPESVGYPPCWDNVIYGGRGLGYVSSAHQRGRFRGASTLCWYEPLDDVPPGVGRQQLLDASWEQQAAAVLAELSPAHRDLRARLRRLDVQIWGHGTTRPVVGLHSGDALQRAAEPRGVVHFAHSDLSGVSLFEEASWHGVRAAEEVLAALGRDRQRSLL